MSLGHLDLSILAPAFVAGVLVLTTHVPLGMQVLQRGIVFIDLAIAQIAALGVIFAHGMEWESPWKIQVCAALAAILGALLLTYSERRWPDIQEALIGVLFVIASCLGIILLAGNPHAGEHLKDLLVGQILWVNTTQLQVCALLAVCILAIWLTTCKRLNAMSFYLLFACAVTGAVQLVGVYLVFASLIIPALATRHLTRHRLLIAYLIGMIAYLLGLVSSSLLDLPSGALIVLVMAGVGMLCSMLSGKRTA